MNPLVYHIVSGHSFFTGIGLILLAVAVSFNRRPAVRRMFVVLFVVGVIGVALSSTQVAVKTLAPAGFFVTPLANLALAVSGGAVGYAVGRTVEQQRLAERNASADSTLKDVADDEEVKPSVELVGHSMSAGHSEKTEFD